MKKLNLLNQKFGRLTVISQEPSKGGKTIWKCLCECGNITTVTSTNLTCGKINSCGCIRKEQIAKRNTTHHQRHTKLYEVWKAIKQRCYNPKSHAFKNYGERGIRMCQEWLNDFQSFYIWSYNNGYSIENQKNENKKLTIDRIDVNKDYSPENCRWVNRTIQARNKRNTKFINYNNKSLCLAEWCEILNLKYETIKSRLNKGWSVQRAFETPTTKTFNGTH